MTYSYVGLMIIVRAADSIHQGNWNDDHIFEFEHRDTS